MKLVPGEGPIPAQIAFVGEAPGADEERLQRPFVGQSGRLLEKLMTSAGIYRQLSYITNVIKERPPGNDVSKFITLGRGGRITPEYETYVEQLRKELERVDPNIIIAVGNVSLYALTGLTGISKYRGSILESTLLPGKKVIPILHPAAALRTWVWTHFIRKDLGRVKEESEYSQFQVTPRRLTLDPTFQEALEAIVGYRTCKFISFDIEIQNGEVSHISFSDNPERGLCIPFVKDGQENFDPTQETALWKAIGELLEDEEVAKVGHNVVFDSSFLLEKYGIKSKNLYDTMIAQAILFPDFPKSLAFLTSIYTDVPYYKDEGKERFRHGVMEDGVSTMHVRKYLERAMGFVPSKLMFEAYSALDSVVLMEIFPKQLKDLEKIGNLETFEFQRLLIEPILFMTQRGIRVYHEEMERKSHQTSIEAERLIAELEAETGLQKLHSSPKVAMEYFYKTKKIKPYVKNGKPTVDEKALKRIAAKGYKEAKKILRIRNLKKLDSTYLKVRLDDRKRLRYSINPVGTRFGRFSSGQDIFGRGTNVQNLPPQMRQFLGPDDGYVAFEIDLSQAENRIVAYLGNEIKMINAFESNLDIHTQTASLVLGKPFEQISKEKGSSGIGNYSERDIGKRANHALNYDMSANMAALQWEVELSQAKPIVEKYHRAYPGVRAYQEIIKNELLKTATLTNLFGRRYRFMDRMERELFKEGYSYMAQSTVADKINRHGLIPLYYGGGAGQQFEGIELLAQIHDSIVFQIPLSYGWHYIAKVLLTILKSLEQPLTSWHNREFVIPCGVKILPKNLLEGHEFKPGSLPAAYEFAAKKLEEVYNQMMEVKE